MGALPTFKIGDLEINLIQGGMSVGVSGRRLVSAVANEGGAGIIGGVALGLLHGYSGNYAKTNAKALRDEIRAARKMSDGVIGVNLMRVLSDYDNLAEAAVEEEVDLIINGGGLPLDFPKFLKGGKTKSGVIVSSLRAAKLITRKWEKKYFVIPDVFIVEGPKAGGHLGFKYDDLINGTASSLESIARSVVEYANGLDRPVVVAGGIYYGGDIQKARGWGASGVQMATRFVATRECDAHDNFKNEHLRADEKDIVLISSPVGMPGRAILNPFLEKIDRGEKYDFNCRWNCLRTCNSKKSQYCIIDALVNAVKGNLDKGFAFAGTNAYRATRESCLDSDGKFITVKTLMKRLGDEYSRGQISL